MAAAPAQQLPAPYIVSALLAESLIIAGVAGIDENIEQPIINMALNFANDLIAQWQHERYMVYQLVDYSFASTGAQNYTVGAGQNFNINPRPDRLEFAFLRQFSNSAGASGSQGSGSPFSTGFSDGFGPLGAPAGAGSAVAISQPFDWPLEIINAYEDYAAIRLKMLGTFSTAVFYDPGWPIGTLKPWPVPQASIYELHILCKQTLQRFPNLQASVMFPPEYGPALKWCLARRFKVGFQMPRDPDLNALAAQGKNVIRKANAQIPTLRYPDGLPGRGGAAYNYRSDQP